MAAGRPGNSIMKFLIYRWQAYNQAAFEDTLISLGHETDTFTCEIDNPEEDAEFEGKLDAYLKCHNYDAVISINYFPVIAKSCNRTGCKYIAWTCDSPMLTLYTKSVFLPCNYIFVFDMHVYCEFKARGVKNIWYMPLAADIARNNYILSMTPVKDYHADISFVGSLYEKNRYDEMVNMPPYIRGYFDALINVQMETYGDNFLERMVSHIEEQLEGGAVNISGDEFIGTPSLIVANTTLGMKLASLERRKILNMVSRKFKNTRIYTGSSTEDMPFIQNMGKVDYIYEMPHVFRQSEINLNITLRNIKTGIPLRIWDILAAGGFVLTNFQAELPEFFEQGKHLVWYDSHSDMMDKIDYYLEHKEEREEIAKEGNLLVQKEHTMQKRVEEILKIVYL